jgi:hypothetical protein
MFSRLGRVSGNPDRTQFSISVNQQRAKSRVLPRLPAINSQGKFKPLEIDQMLIACYFPGSWTTQLCPLQLERLEE